MGDPFSVAGTAVGITSLGIQVFQILSRYYSQYRGIHNEINDVVDRANALEAYLSSLARVKQKIETDDVALSTELQQALRACEDVLARLKDMAKRCGETKAPNSFSDRMRMARKRLLWPFKRDTLMDLQTTLDRFQSHLGLALQLLGLDHEANQLKTLVAETKKIHEAINDISAAQVAQATQLNAGILQLSNQLAWAHVTASDGLDAVSTTQKSQTALIQARFDSLSDQHEQLLKQSAAMQCILEQLASTASISHPIGTPSLPNIVSNEQAARTVRKGFNQSLSQHKTNIPRNQSRNMSMLTKCLCRGTAAENITTRVGKWITFYSESAYEHSPSCPYFSHSDFSKNVGLRFTMCNFLIRKCVQAGFQQSRSQGWSTISPFFRYRAVVPSNSGVFKAINDVEKIAYDLSTKSNTLYQKEVEEILSNLINTMRRCFGKTAHPTDVNEHGQNILESIMRLLGQLCTRQGIENPGFMIEFLDMCHNMGLFSADAEGTAMTWWQENVIILPGGVTLDIFCFLARRSILWKLYFNLLHEEMRPICNTVSKMLLVEDVSPGLLEKDRLHGAILRRSELDFQTCIQTSNSRYLTSVFTTLEYAVPLSCWSIGLDLLISSGSIDDIGEIQTSLWKAAIVILDEESLQILIGSQWRASIQHWFLLNTETFGAFWENGVKSPQGSDAEHYRPIFQSLAAKLSRQLEFDRSIEPGPEGAMTSSREIPFYHAPYLHVTTATDLWDAGYRNIDTIHPEAPRRRTHETPLWMVASMASVHWTRDQTWPVAWWFIEKGANAFWSHPSFMTTPAHILVRKAVQRTIYYETLGDLQSTCDLLLSSQFDGCSCYCSLSGCCVFSCAISKYDLEALNRSYKKKRVQQDRFWNQNCLPWLFSILDQKDTTKEMVLAAIRLLTFEELSLTHTCCLGTEIDEYLFLEYAPLEENEIEEIQYIEKKEKALLEKLMKEFENEWHNHSGTFTSFIKKVWRPRIKALRAEQKDLHEIYQETGIKLSASQPDYSELQFWELFDGSEKEEEEDSA